MDAMIRWDWRAWFLWHCGDNLFEHRVRLAGNHNHSDDGQPVSPGVNEMHLHCKPLALDKVLARMMEVELLQRISAVAQVERVAFREVKLNGVAVVDDRVGSLGPADPERRLPGADRGGDVDGRLLATCRACCIRRVETTPFFGSCRSLVAPMAL